MTGKHYLTMKTFILFWNPAISSYTLGRLTEDIQFGDINSDFNWSVWEHQLAHEGDRFFMVRCKNKPVPGKMNQWGKQVWEPCIDEHTGICMAGTFTSEPYRDADWAGRGRETYYMDMHIDVAVNPDKMPVLKTADLMEAIPDFDWKGGHSGRLIDDEKAEKVAALWDQFLREHKDEICDSKDAAFIDDDLYNEYNG